MVYGNYVVQDGRVGGEGARGGRSGERKRNRGFRTAAELNLTLPPPRRAELEEMAPPEPSLVRYASVSEAEGEAPRRASGARRREGGSPPLPTIEEHTPAPAAEQRRTRLSLYPVEAARDRSGFDAANYFTSPGGGHKFTAKVSLNVVRQYSPSKEDQIGMGTHPDSLCRVPMPGDSGGGGGLPARCYRLLRWPAALLLVCVALALFIYYVMPDSAELEFLQGNATSWEAGGGLAAAAAGGAGFRHRPAQTSPAHPRITSPGAAPPSAAETKTTEIEFGTTMGEVPSSAETPTPTEDYPPETIEFHPVPVYPDAVSPDVQYGNEESPGVRPHTAHETEVDPAHSTLRPRYQQTKGQLALYVKEDDEEAPQDAEGPRGDAGGAGQARGFTSGHSKLFGLSAEEAERLRATTRHTPVSPTLPAMHPLDSTTGSSHHHDDGVSCRSTRLERCRRVLRYDLTALPLVPAPLSRDEHEELLDDFERLAAFECNRRVVEFLCHVLEPECTTSSVSSKRPCKNFCEDSITGCKGKVYPNSTLEAIMECSLYPEEECIPAREPCLAAEVSCEDGTCVPAHRRCDGKRDCSSNVDELNCSLCNTTEYQCPQGSCIPKQWLCDGYADCVFGEDETNCRAGPDGFMPHPYSKQPPLWAVKFLNAAGAGAEDASETAESMLAPRVQLPSNMLPTPSKVDRNRVLETSKMHDPVAKGEAESTELLLMSDSSSAARPYQRTPPRRPAATAPPPPPPPPPTSADPVGELLDDLERMVDSEKWWEEGEGGGGRAGGTAHASPCPAGELRCVDGRCIMFSQLCDGHVDCVDSADEDNCGA